MKCKTHKEEMPDGICDSCLREEDQREKRPAWYEASTGNHQGLIIEETTGRNVAVAYDKADAPLIAAARELLHIAKAYVAICEAKNIKCYGAKAVIAKAEGGGQK